MERMGKRFDHPTGLNNTGEAPLISRVASEDTLDRAFDWVCKRREDYSHNSDIWDLRRDWEQIKPNVQQALLTGDYSFSPLREIRTDCDIIELWSARG